MTDISVIILIGQEKIHLQRCVEKLAPLEPRQIFLVESHPDDGGVAIAKETAEKLGLRLETRFNKWPENQAMQFNWALDNLPIEGKWILRLDADEYLTAETMERLRMPAGSSSSGSPSANTPNPLARTSARASFAYGLADVPDDVAGLTLELKRKFMGGEVRHGTNGIRQVRIFRRGKGRYPESLMDERIQVDGKVVDFEGAFYDDNLNGLGWWKAKHRGYAGREAEQAIESMRSGVWTDPRKAAYYKLPRYFRAVAYFCIRYFLKLGFLDGLAGWRWNFWQGLWYRWVVDREIGAKRRDGR